MKTTDWKYCCTVRQAFLSVNENDRLEILLRGKTGFFACHL